MHSLLKVSITNVHFFTASPSSYVTLGKHVRVAKYFKTLDISKNGFKTNLWNDKRSEAGTLGPFPPAKLGKSLIHSHTDSATPCSSSHKSATLEPLTADMVAVQTIDFRKKVASLSNLILLFVGLQVLHICWVLSFTVLIRFFLD